MNELFNVKDKVVVITGGAGILGKGIAAYLAKEGAKVVCQVVSNLVKGDKVLVFHKKRRKGHRKLNGHRQQFTELTITEVVA